VSPLGESLKMISVRGSLKPQLIEITMVGKLRFKQKENVRMQL